MLLCGMSGNDKAVARPTRLNLSDLYRTFGWSVILSQFSCSTANIADAMCRVFGRYNFPLLIF